jgi:hypothetical protein
MRAHEPLVGLQLLDQPLRLFEARLALRDLEAQRLQLAAQTQHLVR